ncbi:MAG: choline/ethanolamine kinase family protein [Aestuariivirga sp.]
MSAEDRVRKLPCWKGAIDLVPLKGGVSNASFTVCDANGQYVARVGHDYPFHHVFREAEVIASKAAFAAGLSPEVVYTEPGIMVLRFMEARTYGEADVRANADACVDIVKRCHREMGKRISGRANIFWVFHVLRDYAHTITVGKHRHVPDIPRWMAEVERLEAAQVPLPIIFGHHDLLPTNFMDDGKRLWLIDWEYGGFGTAMFDLANIASNNQFAEQAELELLTRYFERAPDQALLRAFYAMKTASALREAVWGMVSEIHLNAPGVDYVAYAREYLSRYENVLADYNSKFGKT